MDIFLYFGLTIIILVLGDSVSGIDSYTNCVKPGKHLEGCTSSKNRIFEGEKVAQGAIPWQVLLRLSSDNRYFTSCGGSIISHQFVLTAAHCFIFPLTGNTSWNIQINISYIMSGSIQFDEGQKHGIQRLIVHPKYDWKFLQRGGVLLKNDIAVVQVTKPFVYGPNVMAICLPKVGLSIPEGSKLTVSGWGVRTIAGLYKYPPEFSETLMRTELKTLSIGSSECRFGRDDQIKEHSKICTYNPPNDYCNGDSGGPLTMAVEGQCVLVGIASEGYICGGIGHGGLVVNVTFHREWILTQIKEFCEHPIPSGRYIQT